METTERASVRAIRPAGPGSSHDSCMCSRPAAPGSSSNGGRWLRSRSRRRGAAEPGALLAVAGGETGGDALAPSLSLSSIPTSIGPTSRKPVKPTGPQRYRAKTLVLVLAVLFADRDVRGAVMAGRRRRRGGRRLDLHRRAEDMSDSLPAASPPPRAAPLQVRSGGAAAPATRSCLRRRPE